MTITERRQREKEAIRKQILEAASRILIQEGYQNLSIRKIAAMIEYSPGLIYHYFRDKEAIIVSLVDQGYQKILERLATVPINREQPEQTIIETSKAYIELVLESPLEYQAIFFNKIEAIKPKVAILTKGISQNRQSIRMLCELIELGIAQGRFRPRDVELTAQIIWTSTFGLMARLLLEQDIPSEQRQTLINHHFDMLLYGLMR